MKQEIRQNGKTVLYSGDGHSIPHEIQQPCREEPQRQGVFGLYRFRSHSRHGIYLREDSVLFGREFNRNGGNQAITFPLYVSSPQVRDG